MKLYHDLVVVQKYMQMWLNVYTDIIIRIIIKKRKKKKYTRRGGKQDIFK